MRRERHPSKQRTPGHFWIVLAGICTVGLVLRLLIVGEYVAENPLAKTLLVDAAVYWAWAARVADGVLVQDTPFFSAPLYPYLLGLARRLGASLATVYTAQALMDVATAGVLGWAGFKRFGTTTGLLAAGAFLALREPASFSLRVLTCSLQLLLLAVVYRQLVVVQATPTLWRRLILGLVLGLLCLAYPPAMLLVVAVGPWLFWQSARRPRDAWPAAGVVGVAALVIAPATVHNWYVTGGDLFFIQSATAINLRQGNQPRSNGGYTAIPGTSAGRDELFEDVAREYETSTGHTAGWAEINRHYRRQVVDFWRADPVRTMNLVIAKVRFFLTARNYGDIYVPSAEVARGLASRLVLAPLPTAWLIGPALVGLVLLARHPVRHGPELMMFAIPFLLVAVFWYTPRYRLPAIPALVMAGAWALQRAAAWRTHWRTTISVCGALSLVAVMGAVNRVSEFDPVRSAELEAQLGAAAKDQGRHEDAAGHFSAALEIRPGFAQARYELGSILGQQRQYESAAEHLTHAVELEPGHAVAHNDLGLVLTQLGQVDDAVLHYREALRLRPDLAAIRVNLGSAMLALGRLDEAVECYREAVAIEPGLATAHYNLANALRRQSLPDEAEQAYREAIRLRPDYAKAHCNLGHVLAGRAAYEEAIGQYRTALRIDPRLVPARYSLALTLAQAGRRPEALKALREVLRLDPGHEKARAAEKALRAQIDSPNSRGIE